MSLVYKSGLPDIDSSKVRIDIPAGEMPPEGDILRDLQKGGAAEEKAPAQAPKSSEDKAAEDIERALRGGK
jgi:hypothetical protein